jgi:hypothetical protein
VTKRRREEALEECLAALARGQSTVEECLAHYPELAAELKPLLHTARRLQDGYAVDPSPLYVQAARERFLTAMARRRQARLAARPARPFWRWVPAALGSAALVAFAVWAGVLAWSAGGGSQEPPSGMVEIVPISTPEPVVSDVQRQVEKLQGYLEEIRTGAESGDVEPVIIQQRIQQLKEDTAALVANLDQPEALEAEDVSQIDELLADQEKVLSEVKEKVAPEAAEDLDEIIRIAWQGRAKVEGMLAPTATPTPTAVTEESPTSTTSPTVTPSATETPEEIPTQTSQPSPSPTPEGGEEPSPTETAAP